MRDEQQFKLMIPADLKAVLQQVAQGNHRSLSAQIIRILENWVAETGITIEDPVGLKPPTNMELELEGKVMALESLVGDLLSEAIESGRVSHKQVDARIDLHRSSTFGTSEMNTLPEQCISGGRVTLARIGSRLKQQKILTGASGAV